VPYGRLSRRCWPSIPDGQRVNAGASSANEFGKDVAEPQRKSPVTLGVKRGSSSVPICAQQSRAIYEAFGLVGDQHLCVCLRLGQSVISSFELDGQTVPSPFGEGCGDSRVASWLLRLLLIHATAASVFWKERMAPSSGHRKTLNSPRRRASLDMLCCVCGMSMESKSYHSHSGFGWSEVGNATASCARAAAVKIARLSALIMSSQCLRYCA
jgi:hypothetical protein